MTPAAQAAVAVLLVALAGSTAPPQASPGDGPAALPSTARTPAAPADGTLRLPPDAVRRAGLTVEVATPIEDIREVAALGRVLDPLPLIDATQGRAAAASVLTAAEAEYTRMSRLHAHDLNASTRDLEAAVATRDRAAADLTVANARLAQLVGSAATALPDLGASSAALAGGGIALARLDLPAGARIPSPPRILKLVAATGGDAPIAARVLGRAPTTDPLLQGEAYLLLIEEHPPLPGTALLATVAADERPQAGVAVPRTAVVWYDGAPCAFVALGPKLFERRRLTLHSPRGERWLVTAGITAGERLVTAGAQQLLSAQLLAAQPES